MQIFNVPCADYYHSGVNQKNIQLCRETMLNVIERYGLVDKSILSLGSGEGHEEYWLWQNGCRLTFVDNNPMFIDRLSRLPVCNGDASCLHFYVGDADEAIRQWTAEFDTCYVSSFHPDEIRREEIQAHFITIRNNDDQLNYVTWPRGAQPYLDTLMKCGHTVKPGGLIIFQHYRGGVDLTYNRHYLPLVRKQMREYGMELIEVHYFANSPAIQLLVAVKGDLQTGIRFLKSLQGRPEIRTFHGRYPLPEYKNDVLRGFSLLDAGQS